MRIGRREVALTNLDKVFFPRPGRYPDGMEGEFVYQKRIDLDPSEGNPWELVPGIALVVADSIRWF